MSETFDGPSVARALIRFTLSFTGVAVVVAASLVATGHWPGAVGVLVSPISVGALTARFRRVVRAPGFTNPAPSGVTGIATVAAIPGVIVIFVGYLIGGGAITLFSTAIGSSLIGAYGVMIALARSLARADRTTTSRR